MPYWGWRCFHYGLAALCTAAAVAGMVLLEHAPVRGGSEPPEPWVTATFAFGWAGAILIRYTKARYVARIFLIAATTSALGAFAAGLSYAQSVDGTTLAVVNGFSAASNIASWLIVVVILPQAFPDGPLRVGRWPLIFRSTLLITCAIALSFGFLLVTPSGLLADVLWTVALLSIFLGACLGAVSLFVRRGRASEPDRRQLNLYVSVNAVGAALLIASIPLPEPFSNVFQPWWPVAVVAVIAWSVLRSQLYDIRLVLKRVALNAVLAAMVAVMFIAVYFGALLLASERLEGADFQWLALASAAVGVVLLEPLRRRLRRALERRVLGDRSDPLAALDRLHERLNHADEATIFGGVVETVAAAVRSPRVAMTVHRDIGEEVVATVGASDADATVVPLTYIGERLGELQVAPRTEGEAFGRVDRLLLDQLARSTAALVYAKRRDVELVAARRETLDAVIEERSRLGRDLHDGLAPLLAGAGLSAEALRRNMDPGSADEQDAARLAALLRRTAGDARRLAHDLQPVGFRTDLATALTDYVANLKGSDSPSFTVAIDVAEIPGSLAQAAYLVLLEAINNVVRHAHATTAWVSASTDDHHLSVEVVDDGVGMAQPYVSGIGITSMRRRVEALGGRLTVGPGPRGGTRVVAVIPLAEERH